MTLQFVINAKQKESYKLLSGIAIMTIIIFAIETGKNSLYSINLPPTNIMTIKKERDEIIMFIIRNQWIVV